MKPIKILLYLISIFVILALVSFIFPREGLYLGNNLLLRYPDFQHVFSLQQSNRLNIQDILDAQQLNLVSDSSIFQPPDTIDSEKDTTTLVPDSLNAELSADTISPSDPPDNQKQVQPPGSIHQYLEYPHHDKSVLYPFFQHLSRLKTSGELIRILHYGDSQIEGDRITSYIRNELQQNFGGSGVGMFPPVLIKGTNISLQHQLGGSWQRYTIKSIENGNLNHKRLGTLMSFGRFAPVYERSSSLYAGEIMLKKSNITYLRTREFKRCRVFYGFNKKPFIAELKYKDQSLDAELIPPAHQLQTLSWDINGSLNEITISFRGEDSPDIYAIAIDGQQGVAVDNIPLRGSSGTDFTRTDMAFFRSMYQKLNAKLIIMQFGVNLVPHIVDDYSYYEHQFYKQLKTLKGLRPDICIIVIGVSDMSRNVMGHYESYPNIEKIRTAQKNAAFKAGCAFWDMYEAMGGKNSMPAWVNANPPLARTDFTHFTWKGSVIISKMFYDAFIHDYYEYLKHTNTITQNNPSETDKN
ncbi:MAG: hypothetical protein V2I54_01895 [Bacteroidales bacterium]|jgi:hypothetical protein|nr:hypothetical protein [Bacteroidales bacterium]